MFPTVLDEQAAKTARDNAIATVGEHSEEAWKTDAAVCVARLARSGRPFTSDDVWATGLRKPHEPRALGAIFVYAAKLGTIKKTGRWINSRQTLRHHAPIAEWVGT